MFSNVVLLVPSIYVHEVGLEPVHECAICLSYILLAAVFACDAVNEIAALTCNILLGFIFTSGVVALDLSSFILKRTKSMSMTLTTF